MRKRCEFYLVLCLLQELGSRLVDIRAIKPHGRLGFERRALLKAAPIKGSRVKLPADLVRRLSGSCTSENSLRQSAKLVTRSRVRGRDGAQNSSSTPGSWLDDEDLNLSGDDIPAPGDLTDETRPAQTPPRRSTASAPRSNADAAPDPTAPQLGSSHHLLHRCKSQCLHRAKNRPDQQNARKAGRYREVTLGKDLMDFQ
jgi:hypothetical protein